MIIYQIRNLVNDKTYIGKTKKSAKERLHRHFWNAKNGHDTYLYKSIRKYGESSFIIEVIEHTSEHELNDREIFWISKLSPQYNMTAGGDGGDTSKSDNFIKNIKIYHANKLPSEYATYGMLEKSHTNDGKHKISKANSYAVVCDGVVYESINAAQLKYPGIKVRGRLDNPKYPEFHRLRPKRIYPIIT